MADSVDSIIAEFRSDFYPGCSVTRAGTLFNEAYKKVLKEIKVRTAEVTLSLVAGQREYTISEVNQQVNFAIYKPSVTSSGWKQLKETSLDRLSVIEPGWQSNSDSDSAPSRYYFTAVASGDTSILKIGLDPIPDTTTSGGYPCVVLNVTQNSTLTGSETVPEGLLNNDPYLFYMAYKYASRQDAVKKQYYYEEYVKALADNQEFFEKKLVLDRPFQFISPFARAQRSVV